MTTSIESDNYRETVEYVSTEIIKLRSITRYRNGTNDYSRESTKIIAIVNNHNFRHDGIWGEDWVELSTGVLTRQCDLRQQVKILRNSCPVRVLYCSFLEYVSYDFQSHSQESREYYWVKYVTEQDDE